MQYMPSTLKQTGEGTNDSKWSVRRTMETHGPRSIWLCRSQMADSYNVRTDAHVYNLPAKARVLLDKLSELCPPGEPYDYRAYIPKSPGCCSWLSVIPVVEWTPIKHMGVLTSKTCYFMKKQVQHGLPQAKIPGLSLAKKEVDMLTLHGTFNLISRCNWCLPLQDII